jgi:hypothetical protein
MDSHSPTPDHEQQTSKMEGNPHLLRLVDRSKLIRPQVIPTLDVRPGPPANPDGRYYEFGNSNSLIEYKIHLSTVGHDYMGTPTDSDVRNLIDRQKRFVIQTNRNTEVRDYNEFYVNNPGGGDNLLIMLSWETVRDWWMAWVLQRRDGMYDHYTIGHSSVCLFHHHDHSEIENGHIVHTSHQTTGWYDRNVDLFTGTRVDTRLNYEDVFVLWFH